MRIVKRVFSVENVHYNLEKRYDFKIVAWGHQVAETKTTNHFSRVGYYVYFKGELIGLSVDVASYKQKVFKINKKKIPEMLTEKLKSEAVQKAIMHVITQGQQFNAKVIYWDKMRASGMVEVFGVGVMSIDGCNAYNALTAFNETCCVYLNKNEVISVELANMGTHVAPTRYTAHFDAEKSNSLDHSKLSFKKQNGKLISGLF